MSHETNAAPAENGAQERLFTQAELDAIIKARLFDRKKAQQEMKDHTAELEEREKKLAEAEAALSERESAVKLSEIRIACQEYAKEQNYPDILTDVIDTSDYEKFKEKADMIAGAFAPRSQAPMFNADAAKATDINIGFSRDYKHTPKNRQPLITR